MTLRPTPRGATRTDSRRTGRPRCPAFFAAIAIVCVTACASREAPPPTEPRVSLYSFGVGAHDGVDAAEQTLSAMREAQVRMSTVLAQALSLGASLWLVEHGDCPTPDDIVRERLASESVRAEDAWGNDYRIECGGPDHDAPVVTSAGPDGVLDTTDDIAVGRLAPTR